MFDCQFKLSNIFSVSYDILKVMWFFGLCLYCTRIPLLLILYIQLLMWDSVGFLGLPFHQEFVHEVILWYFLTLTESSITSNKGRSWNALMLCRTCLANHCFLRQRFPFLLHSIFKACFCFDATAFIADHQIWIDLFSWQLSTFKAHCVLTSTHHVSPKFYRHSTAVEGRP